MDNSYHQVHQIPPFAYFHPNGKLDVQQSELAHHHANANALLYQSQMSFNMFSPPEESNNSIPFSQLYHNGYPGSVQISSYKKENHLGSNIPPNLMIQPNIHENDVYYYPSTPPLSASSSISGSPSDYASLPTPANTNMFGIHRNKDELLSENSSCPNWICYDSPPITPAFVQSGSLISDDLPHNSNTSLQRLNNSPSTSPLPNQVPTDHNLDFCDPRKLTVCPGIQTCTNLETSDTSPNVVHLSPSRGVVEDQKSLLNRSISPRNFDSKAPSFHGIHQSEFPTLEPTSDFDVGENYFCGISNFAVPDQSLYIASKRQRTDSGISLSHGPVINPVGFQEIDQSGSYNQFAITCPLSPPISISQRYRKNEKRLKKAKKMSLELSDTSDLNPEIYESEIGLKSDYTSEPPNNCKNDKANETSKAEASEKSKSGDVSKPQHQVTRRGRKQSETEDLTKTFVCESCNRRFKRQEHLKRHYRSVHTQEKPFKCHECGKDFSRSDNLSQHARTHGNGSIVVGLLEEGEITNDIDANCEHIGNLGSILFNAAAAAPGSETDRSSQCSSNASSIGKDSQSRKKRRRSE